jgi:heptaprenyl diphosphate synthase
LKSVGQGLVTGTLASYVFLFSAAGTLASLLSMKALKRLAGDRMTFIGLGTIGALASNAVQLALSLVFIFGHTAIVIAPLLLGIGTVSGVLMGSFAQAFRLKSKWLARVISAWRANA